MNPEVEKIFFEIHSDIPRQGPGSDASTRRAYGMLAGVADRPRVADIGCGPGRQTRVIAEVSGGTVCAVDLYPLYLAELAAQLPGGFAKSRIAPVRADMAALPFRRRSLDVIWAEGSIYIIGFENGLRAWRPLLRPGGFLAATEITWLKKDPPETLRRFWEDAYPPMTTAENNMEAAAAAGYRSLGRFVLPEAAWWDDYYSPIERKLAAMEPRYRNDPAAREVMEMERAEIALYRKYADWYGYVFYVMQKG